MNSANSQSDSPQDQAVTASVQDVLHLGCAGVGFTIYPGNKCYDMMEELREIIREAKSGSIISRNSFKRPKTEALAPHDQIIKIYLSEA